MGKHLMPRAFLKLFAMLSFGISMWAQTAAVPGEPPADLDAFVANSMKTFDVPGMAVTIVKDGKIAVAKGYGVRKLGDATPVDEFTMFAIGSNTKAFTTASLATLVDQGKLYIAHGDGREELYDLAADPAESKDLSRLEHVQALLARSRARAQRVEVGRPLAPSRSDPLGGHTREGSP